ncbi:hypothetical protein D0Z07_6195 [Hyphodiscus hymeniophilus]|uniref:Ubiquitin 3 binding protein But2 C-terminal domain-containing protein n=1 Tax=Hyphodiscus hymeniophilus TaxID=353542 RepID=A0A9P6VFF2_9HELO|nr:hypothetical protein D0Z07_6195 [Hyphodiscus hymeniophilus]
MLFIIPLFVAFCLNISASISAAVLPRQSQTPCSFVMSAVGVANGSVVQDTDGENRIGGTYPQASYYISTGALFDGLEHHCVIMPSFQFQCILGSSGSANFSFADDGNLMQGDEEDWWACPAPGPGDDGSYNIFSYGLVNTTGCEALTLKAEGFNCTDPGVPPVSSTRSSSLPTLAPTHAVSSASAISSSTSSAIASAAPTIACPNNISSGIYQFPHLIVPTSPDEPDHEFGDSYSAYISPINTTIFNFDIPPTAPYNDTCALIFLFPFGGTTYFSGIEEEEGEKGGLDFASLAQVATAETTYNTIGAVWEEYGLVEVLPGNNYTIATFPCGSRPTISYQVSSKGNVEVDFFQQSGSNPMGLYVVPCNSTCD